MPKGKKGRLIISNFVGAWKLAEMEPAPLPEKETLTFSKETEPPLGV